MASLTALDIWVSEHYWPGLADELVIAQSQRLGRARGWSGTVILPGQQTAFGLYVARGSDEVREALALVGMSPGVVDAAWLLSPATS